VKRIDRFGLLRSRRHRGRRDEQGNGREQGADRGA
jgi:hypothetical protein